MKQKQRKIIGDMELTILALPGLIWFLLFSYLPMTSIVLAFKDFRISGNFIQSLINSEWVGFENFQFVFANKDIWMILRNTVGYGLIFLILGIVIPIMVAIMISEVLSDKLAKFAQSAMFLPYFISWVVVSYFVFALLSPENGLVNRMLMTMGLESIAWYSEPKYWPAIIIILNTWKTVGYGTVVYLASIVGIDRTYYEAACIDGATKWQQLRYITLELIKPVVVVMFILSIGKLFTSDFGLFYQLPRNAGALFSATQTIDTFVYRTMAVLGDMGMSSAVALFQSGVGLILVIASNMAVKKIDEEYSLF